MIASEVYGNFLHTHKYIFLKFKKKLIDLGKNFILIFKHEIEAIVIKVFFPYFPMLLNLKIVFCYLRFVLHIIIPYS